ncbi:hypothetical protein EII17_04025 [Clostridiales bacterium COT073_COT-073]|nr:hypothetical protein EII17_04025 [Clostridiales bacterium COT073_COT-073]
MAFRNIFHKPTREVKPMAYYASEEPMGRLLNENEFSKDIAQNIILFCLRLHEMGVYEEDKIITFDVQGMLKMLAEWEVLQGVSISEFTTAQVVFGEKYAGYWYEDRESQPYIRYLVPEQIVIYHQDKAENYYLSLLDSGIDLCQNKVAISNMTSVRQMEVAAQQIFSFAGTLPLKTQAGGVTDAKQQDFTGADTRLIHKVIYPANLSAKAGDELKTVFHILFLYLKYKILIRANKLGYYTWLENFTNNFCRPQLSPAFIDYVKQYFSLNSEKKEFYPYAHWHLSFFDFLERLLAEYKVGFSGWEVSLKKYADYLLGEHHVNLNKMAYESIFEFLTAADKELKKIGKCIYIWNRSKNFRSNLILVGKETANGLNQFGIDLIKLEDIPRFEYHQYIENEHKIRQMASEFYALIGVKEVADLMLKIRGDIVLDSTIYSEGYIAYFDWDEDSFYEMFYDFLGRHGLEHLIDALSVDGRTIDEQRFTEDEEVSSYDRIKLYAPEIKRKGKLLIFLNTGSGSYEFALINSSKATKQRMTELLEELMQIGEIEDYEIME